MEEKKPKTLSKLADIHPVVGENASSGHPNLKLKTRTSKPSNKEGRDSLNHNHAPHPRTNQLKRTHSLEKIHNEFVPTQHKSSDDLSFSYAVKSKFVNKRPVTISHNYKSPTPRILKKYI